MTRAKQAARELNELALKAEKHAEIAHLPHVFQARLMHHAACEFAVMRFLIFTYGAVPGTLTDRLYVKMMEEREEIIDLGLSGAKKAIEMQPMSLTAQVCAKP